MADFTIGQNDTLPSWAYTCVDVDGVPVNLTGYSSVVFSLYTQAGVAVVADRACTITTAAAGLVTLAWQAADTATAGIYNAQFKGTDSGGTYHFPPERYLVVDVVESLS